jgi:ribonuclease VapC
MIAVDTSALVAVIMGEPERAAFVDVFKRSGRMLISAASVMESRIVLRSRSGERLVALFNDVISQAEFEIIAVDTEQARLADAAFILYGKGSGHPAQLNFGDLFSYALAKARNVPLLYKGADFAQTDITDALERT